MQGTTDAVTVEVLNDGEPMATGAGRNRTAHVAESATGPSGVHGIALRQSSRLQEAPGERRGGTDRNAHPGVGPVPVELGRDVEIYQVAGPEASRDRGDAVCRLVIDTDAGRSRKLIGEAWCRPGTVAAEDLPPNGVEFSGCDARCHRGHHGAPGAGDNASSP